MKVVRSFLVLIGGSAAAQIVTVCASPVLSRIYSPDVIGYVSTYVGIAMLVASLCTFSYHYAIVLPKNEDIVATLIFLSVGLSFLFIILLSVFVWYVDISNSNFLIYLFPFFTLIMALRDTFQQVFIRKQKYSYLSRVNMAQSIVVNSAKIMFGLVISNVFSLIFATLISSLFGLVMFLPIHCREYFTNYKFQINKVMSAAWEYKDFCLYRTPELLMTGLTQSVPLLVISFFYGIEYAGYYGMARSVLALPTLMIGRSMSDLLYPTFSRIYNDGGDLYSSVFKYTVVMVVLGVLFFGFLIMFGPRVFSIIFGMQWEYAGLYSQWLSLMLLGSFVSVPVITVIPVISMQKDLLKFSLITKISSMGILVFLSFVATDVVAISVYSGLQLFLYIYFNYIILKRLYFFNERA